MTKRRSLLFLATAALGACSALNADTLSMSLKIDNGTLNQVATSTNGTINYTTTATNYSNISINASGTPALLEPGLDLNTLDVTSSGAGATSLLIELTEQGLTTLTSPLPVAQSFASILRGATSISFANYVDPSNTAYGMAEMIGSYSTSAQGSTAQNMTGTEIFTNGSPFSETEVISIGFSGAAQSAFGDDNIAAAPEPMSLGLLGGGLMALGIARLRRAKKA